LRTGYLEEKKEVTRSWRKSHEEILITTSYIIRIFKPSRMRGAGACDTREMINVCKVLIGKPEGKRQFA
jgi:hypothetical protein